MPHLYLPAYEYTTSTNTTTSGYVQQHAIQSRAFQCCCISASGYLRFSFRDRGNHFELQRERLAVCGNTPATNLQGWFERMFWFRSHTSHDHHYGVCGLSAVKYLLLIAVRAYWLAWPRNLHRPCIYRETCSHHVYRIAKQSGFAAGIRALCNRCRTCRPGYAITTREAVLGLLLRDGSFLPAEFVSEDVIAPLHHTAALLEQSLASGMETQRPHTARNGRRDG